MLAIGEAECMERAKNPMEKKLPYNAISAGRLLAARASQVIFSLVTRLPESFQAAKFAEK